MKHLFKLFAILTAFGFFALSAWSQQQPPPGQQPNVYYGQVYTGPSDYRWYVKVDAGGFWSHDTDLKEFFGESIASDSKVKFDPGVRFGVAGGYWLTRWLGLEAETGFMSSEIKSITDAHIHDAFFSNVPLMANVRIECPRDLFVKPYIGAGAGVSWSIIDADLIEIGSTRMDGSDASAVFAWQAFGGLRFRLNERMGLSLEYHYFWADRPEWEAEFSHGSSSDHLRFGHTQNHAVSVAFDYRF